MKKLFIIFLFLGLLCVDVTDAKPQQSPQSPTQSNDIEKLSFPQIMDVMRDITTRSALKKAMRPGYDFCINFGNGYEKCCKIIGTGNGNVVCDDFWWG